MKLSLIILITLILLSWGIYAGTARQTADYSGTIRLSPHSVYLDTDSGSYLLLLTAGVIRDSVWLPVEASEAVITGYLYPDRPILEVRSITDAAGITLIRDEEFKPIHTATSTYSVNSSGCIGCNLCPRNCPVGAITMQGRKAVIDQSKCVECGICIEGLQRFRGCPVRAIGK